MVFKDWGPPVRVTFCPLFPGGGKQWIHTGDPVEIVGFPAERGGFPAPEKCHFPLGKKGAKVTQNGNHGLVDVWFSLIFIKKKWLY